MQGLINHDIYQDHQGSNNTYQRMFSYTLPNKIKTRKFTNDYVSVQTDNVYLNSPVQEKLRLKNHDQQATHFKLWDTNPPADTKIRPHNYNKTNFELNDYIHPKPIQSNRNVKDKRNSDGVFAALGEERVLRERNSQKKQSTQQAYVNNVKKLFDSFYQPEEVKKRPEYPNSQNNDKLMQMNGSSIDALEKGKESLTEDLGAYFASKGGAKKIKERTQLVPAQVDNIASIKCHKEQ